MRKLFFVLALSLAGFHFSTAQYQDLPAELKWGDELKEPSGSVISKVVASGSWGSYVLRRKTGNNISGEQIFIERYDSDLRLKRSQKIDLRYNGKKREFEDLVMIGRELYLMTSFNNQAKKKNYLFYQKLNSRLVPSKDLVNIGEIDSRDKFRDGKFDIINSRDSSKILIYNQLPFKKSEPERFSLRVFDNQMNELWDKDIVLPYGDDDFSVEEYQIDNNGNVYLLGVIYQDRSRTRRKGKPTYQYTVLTYTQSGSEAQEYRIDLETAFITDLTFRVADDGNLVCSGFYSEKGTYSIKGTYFFRLDAKTKKVFNVNLKPFDFDFLTEYMREGSVERARKAEARGDKDRTPELYQYSLNDLILRSDGGAVLIAEQYFVFQQMYRYWDGTMRYDYFYNYNDIIVVNIRPDGEIEWTARIPKTQETLNDGGYYSSFAMAVVRDRFYFIYNENSRNFEGQGNRNRPRQYNFNGRNSVIALTEIKKDGSVSTWPLFTNRDADVITRPKICKQNGSRRMLVYGEIGRDYRFGLLEFTQ